MAKKRRRSTRRRRNGNGNGRRKTLKTMWRNTPTWAKAIGGGALALFGIKKVREMVET